MKHTEATPAASLLLTLEETSQLVSHSRDPAETLANIVQLIQSRFQTDVCSVYLLEPERAELVLGATIGLNAESVGRIRMRLDEGLTGLVAQRMMPVMVAEASEHPRFKYFPEAGEDPYHSFLGVPLVEGGSLQGVLVVQTIEPRAFSSNETRMLVTVGSQLASLVSGARLLERIVTAAHNGVLVSKAPLNGGPATLHAVSFSPGIGLGCAYVVDVVQWNGNADMRGSDMAVEKVRLESATAAAREEMVRLSHRISALVGHGHGAILHAQLMLLQDRSVQRDVDNCLAAGSTAEAALTETLKKYVAAFEKLSDPYFRDRVYDLKDVFRRVLWHLQPRVEPLGDAAGRVVLVAREASVLDLFSIDRDRLAAVVVEHGGRQSHAAILARSLGIPMVGQTQEIARLMLPGQQLLVDATAGVIYADPSPELVVAHQERSTRTPACSPAVVSEMADRTDMPRVEANINLLGEAAQVVEQGACGVGLYRTEFLFLARRTMPTEEEQVGVYRKLLEMLDGRPASIRTFDLRPDKLAHFAHWNASAASPYDWRRVLESPPLQKLFKEQVRAVLRAAVAGPARLLVPLVLRSEQLAFVVETIGEARNELRGEALDFSENVPLGVMIEVAAATAMMDTWAGDVDFFSLGTNDLMASALGLDRDDPVGSTPDDLLHPGLLRILQAAIGAAHQSGRRITVCGEMATDPQAAVALAAMGVDSLSVAVHQLANVCSVFRGHSAESLAELAPQLLKLRTAQQARSLLGTWTDQ